MGSGALIFCPSSLLLASPGPTDPAWSPAHPVELVYPSLRPTIPTLVYYPLAVIMLGVAANLFGHYWLVCSIAPGSPADNEGKGRQRDGEWWWATPRRPESAGRRWDDQVESMADVSPPKAAKVKKCRKCGGAKPEVRLLLSLRSGD